MIWRSWGCTCRDAHTWVDVSMMAAACWPLISHTGNRWKMRTKNAVNAPFGWYAVSTEQHKKVQNTCLVSYHTQQHWMWCLRKPSPDSLRQIKPSPAGEKMEISENGTSSNGRIKLQLSSTRPEMLQKDLVRLPTHTARHARIQQLALDLNISQGARKFEGTHAPGYSSYIYVKRSGGNDITCPSRPGYSS